MKLVPGMAEGLVIMSKLNFKGWGAHSYVGSGVGSYDWITFGNDYGPNISFIDFFDGFNYAKPVGQLLDETLE